MHTAGIGMKMLFTRQPLHKIWSNTTSQEASCEKWVQLKLYMLRQEEY